MRLTVEAFRIQRAAVMQSVSQPRRLLRCEAGEMRGEVRESQRERERPSAGQTDRQTDRQTDSLAALPGAKSHRKKMAAAGKAKGLSP